MRTARIDQKLKCLTLVYCRDLDNEKLTVLTLVLHRSMDVTLGHRLTGSNGHSFRGCSLGLHSPSVISSRLYLAIVLTYGSEDI